MLLCSAVFIIGIVSEYTAKKKATGFFVGQCIKDKAIATLLILLVLLIAAVASFWSYQKITFNRGAEEGYLIGIKQGEFDAENNIPFNASFDSSDVPSNYILGTSKFSGYAFYWQSGYEDGYQSIIWGD